MSDLRLFIAIALPTPVRAELASLQSRLQHEPALKNVRWVSPNNIHLTVKFLGNVPQPRVPALTAALDLSIQNIPPHELVVRGLGCFPNFHRPNNIWAGLQGALDTTALLARQLESECAAAGFPRDDRPFNPHLTLARLNRES